MNVLTPDLKALLLFPRELRIVNTFAVSERLGIEIKRHGRVLAIAPHPGC